MCHIGLLTCRNEADVLAEGLANHTRYFDVIVAQDGSDDGGREILEGHPQVVKIFRDEEILRPGERFTDGHRNHALQWIIHKFGVDDIWVTLLHPEEFWHDDPIQMAEWAAADHATFVLWAEFRFFLHISDHPALGSDMPRFANPIDARIRHYAGPFFERRQFSLKHHQLYRPGADHETLPGCVWGLPELWDHIPRYRHYPYRSPEQIRKRAAEARERMIQPDHALLTKNPYVERLPQPVNSPLAAWENVGYYTGTLPEAEKFLPEWFTEFEKKRKW